MQCEQTQLRFLGRVAYHIQEPEFSKCGWNADVEIQWVNEIYPDDIQDILFDTYEEDQVETEYGDIGESEDEDS